MAPGLEKQVDELGFRKARSQSTRCHGGRDLLGMNKDPHPVPALSAQKAASRERGPTSLVRVREGHLG